MAKVIASERGYIGKLLREPGEVFEWPEGVKLGSWVKPIKAAEVPAEDGEPADPGPEKGKGKKGRAKAETVQQETAEPFADPPPVRVKNEANDATGATEPDWLPPSADDGKPVMAAD